MTIETDLGNVAELADLKRENERLRAALLEIADYECTCGDETAHDWQHFATCTISIARKALIDPSNLS